MESKLYMPQKSNKNKVGLFPNYFKKIGITIMILAFVPAIIAKAIDTQWLQNQKDLFRLLTMNLFLLGLFFIAWARDKVEDEMTVALRLKTLGFTFISAVLFVFVKPFIDLLFREPIERITAQSLLLYMLILYLLLYYFQKKGR